MNHSVAGGDPPGIVGRWFWTGGEFFEALVSAISQSRRCIRLEFYFFSSDGVGRWVLDALIAAARRQVAVQVLADGLNSPSLNGGFWDSLLSAGGRVRIFNPLWSSRRWFRDHRKLVTVDDGWAAVGGFNVSKDYAGDGRTAGWLDCGLELSGLGVASLSASFDHLWDRAGGNVGPSPRLGRIVRPRPLFLGPGYQLLLSGPGQLGRSLQASLRRDFAPSGDVRLATAYFLPGGRLRRAIIRAARAGRRVCLLLPGPTDVRVARRAAHFLYSRLMEAGVEIYEYQPQILHAKLYLFAHSVYVGSANLDVRSGHLNHELMLRITDSALVEEAAQTYDRWRADAVRIDRFQWRGSRSTLEKWKEGLAFWLLARVDPFVGHQMVAHSR